MKYRAFRQRSTGDFTNRIDGTGSNAFGSPHDVALGEVADATGILLSDLEVVESDALPPLGTIVLPMPPASDPDEIDFTPEERKQLRALLRGP